MAIQFDSIPSNLRIPGTFIEFNNRLAGNANINFRMVVISQKMATGNVDAAIPTTFNNKEQAADFWGRGSMMAAQCGAIKKVDPFFETVGIALDENSGGQEATGTITITGPASQSGLLALYIAGELLQISVIVDDTAQDIAGFIVGAIQANTELPVTAAVNGSNPSQVDITCRWKGETGNDIDIRTNYYGEKTPVGITVAITALSGGAGNPSIAPALAAMGDEWYNYIVMPFTDAANLALLRDELESRFGPMRQIGCRAFIAFRGTHAEATTFGNSLNSPHITAMGTNIVPEPSYIWSAINAIVAAKSLVIDPARPLQTLTLPYLKAPPREVRWTDAERNQLLFDGCSTYNVTNDGQVKIERQITSYQLNADGFSDDSYLDVNTPETLERIRFEQRAMFSLKYPRYKLADDSYDVPPGQPVMQPKLARAELLVLYREMEDKGWVQDYDGYAETLIVEINADDPDRMDIYDSPKLVNQLRVKALHSEFRQ